ncbi:MAG: hypothetical protein H6813_06785 [Phycisphaeraceae bacterium]|nr:hypothetical protein [Phycisphaeraceae bacterium]MCB9848640.1 hypothetical protein [Phycisphaeraceae bacterium]
MARTRPKASAVRTLIAAALAMIAQSAAGQSPGAPEAPPSPLTTGRLVVHAIQGTAGANSARGDAVRVELFSGPDSLGSLGSLESTLDENSQTVFDGFLIGDGVRPVISIEHAGVTYQETGPPLTTESPSADLDITVYDATTDEPQWRLGSRQVMLTPESGHIVVSESVIVTNPGDRTWTGGETAPNGKATTVRLGLPGGARDVLLDAGFHGWCCTTFDGATLTVQMPLMPGATLYRFSYIIDPTDGQADLPFATTAPTDELAVFVPDEVWLITPIEMSALSAKETEQGRLRMFYAGNVAPRTAAGLHIDSPRVEQAAATVAQTPGAADGGGADIATTAITIGVALAVVGIGALIVWWGRRSGDTSPAEPQP